MKRESEVTQSCPTLSNPMEQAYQAPPSMGFSGQEYWSGLPFPSLLNAFIASIVSIQLYQFSSVTQSCPTLCDTMDCNTPGFPVHRQLPELALTHVH